MGPFGIFLKSRSGFLHPSHCWIIFLFSVQLERSGMLHPGAS